MSDTSSPAPSDPGDLPGEAPTPQDERYERQGLLGQGGMGRVYAARDGRLRRQVALKIAATPALAGRLAREAWITAQLEHPGIVAVYDAGETDGQAWYTMRLIRGRTLRERLAACPDLPSRLALLPHLHAACQAVAYAHAMGIVHRDLKPSNLMIGEFGETQVADWGLAVPLDEAQADWERIAPGPAAGTPRYMSPEQAAGAPASRASDVYGLGAALYELLRGGPPEPGAIALPPPIPRDLAAIVRRCLQPEPSARYADAGALADDLGRWLAGQRVEAHEYHPVELLGRVIRAWRVPIAVGGVALVALAVVGGIGVRRTAQARSAAEANLAVALTQQGLAALLDERLPEAQVLAAHALRYGPSPEARGILAAIGEPAATRTATSPLPERCRHEAVVAPDARTMACRAEGRLQLWGLDPLARRADLDLAVVEEPVWVGDALLVATADSLVWIRDGRATSTVPGAAWWPIAAGDVAFATQGPAARRLDPDGSFVEFPICPATRSTIRGVAGELVVGCADGVLRTYGPDGGVRRELALGERPAWSVVSDDPHGLIVGRLDGGVQALLLPEGRWTEPVRGPTRSVLALQAVPATPMVLVLGERGGPRIWNTLTGGWAGSLPAGASRMYPGTTPGEVLLVGATLERWQIAGTSRPTVLGYPSGLSQATPSPDGTRLAVALGTGDVVERRLADGQELRRWSWGEEVAKAVAYGGDDVLVGAAMGAPGQVLGPGLARQALIGGSVLRRAGHLGDGRVWALDYAGSALLLSPSTGAVSRQPLGARAHDGGSSPDGSTAVVVDARGRVWQLAGDAWREVSQLEDALAVDVGDGGTPLVVARRREVCIDGRCSPFDGDVLDVALHGGHLAIATLSGDVAVLDVATGELVARLRGHTARVSSVEFGPDGDWLVSGSWDGTARIWDLSGLTRPAAELVAEGERAWGLGLDEAIRAR